MKGFILIALMVFVAQSGLIPAQLKDDKMMKIIVRNTRPDIPEDSFKAKPEVS